MNCFPGPSLDACLQELLQHEQSYWTQETLEQQQNHEGPFWGVALAANNDTINLGGNSNPGMLLKSSVILVRSLAIFAKTI